MLHVRSQTPLVSRAIAHGQRGGGGGSACIRSKAEYRLFQPDQTWVEAVGMCPVVWEGSQLARVETDQDYEIITDLLIASFPNPEDIYQGAWIGANAYNAPGNSNQVGFPSSGWRWVEGTNYDGPFLEDDMFHSRWGGIGTGFGGELLEENAACDPRNCRADLGFSRKQPDNSGGNQRCALIAVGAIPPSRGTPFYDDQRCDGCGANGEGCDGIDNEHVFICELRGCQASPPPAPVPSPPPFPPPFPPITCQGWCNMWTCNMDACSTCSSSICGGR